MRKASLSISLTELVMLVLVLILLFVTFPFFKAIYDAIFSKGDDSLNSFTVMTGKLKVLLQSPEIFAADQAFPYFIAKPFIVVGFNKKVLHQPDKVIDGCGTPPETATKPDICGDSACLCIYKDLSWITTIGKGLAADFDGGGGNKPVQCTVFPDVDYIFSNFYTGASKTSKQEEQFQYTCCFCDQCGTNCAEVEKPRDQLCNAYHYKKQKNCPMNYCSVNPPKSGDNIIPNKVPAEVYMNIAGSRWTLFSGNPNSNDYISDYAYLFLYGHCYVTKGVEFGVQNLYMEKFKSPLDQKTYVYISFLDTAVNSHYNDMRIKYGKKTSAEYEKLIKGLAATDLDKAITEFSNFKINYPNFKLSEDTYILMSSGLSIKIDSSPDPEKLKILLDTAATVNEDYIKFYPEGSKVPDALFRLGNIYFKQQQFDQALDTFNTIRSDFKESIYYNDATSMIDKLEVINELPEADYQEMLDIANNEIKEKFSADMSDALRESIIEDYHRISLIAFAKRIKGQDVKDEDIRYGFEKILEDFPSSDYAASASYRLGMLSTDTMEKCAFFGQIINLYPTVDYEWIKDFQTKAIEKVKINGCSDAIETPAQTQEASSLAESVAPIIPSSAPQPAPEAPAPSPDTSQPAPTPETPAPSPDTSQPVAPSPSQPSSSLVNSPKFANEDPNFLKLLVKLQDTIGAKFIPTAGCAFTGHVAGSYHYYQQGQTTCHALDFYPVYNDGKTRPYIEQIQDMELALQKLGVADKVGLGIYIDTKPYYIFHLDNRGTKARWGRNKVYIEYSDLKKQAAVLAIT